MEITEVRIKLMDHPDDRLQAFCSITLDDCFVVRDLKIIEGANGPFVAMPSRKLTFHCSHCGCKNHLRAAHCNQCGRAIEDERDQRSQEGRAKLYADIAHPINSLCREMIQKKVIAEYQDEVEQSKQPGYVSRYDDEYDEDYDSLENGPSISEESCSPQADAQDSLGSQPFTGSPCTGGSSAGGTSTSSTSKRECEDHQERRSDEQTSHSIDREHPQVQPPHRMRRHVRQPAAFGPVPEERRNEDHPDEGVSGADDFGKGVF